MAVSGSHCNVPNELSDTKECREDKNLQTLASPEVGSTKKKKKRKKTTEESYEEPQIEVCPKPLVDKVVPIVPSEEKAEAITQNPNPTLKKKKKNAQGAQLCDSSLSIGAELDFTKKAEAGQSDANWKGDLCPEPLVDPPIPILPLEGNDGTTTQNPSPTLQKKKKKKKKSVQGAQPCDPSMSVGGELGLTEKEVTRTGDANLSGDLCSKPLLDTPITIVLQDGKTKTTAENPNSPFQKKKKKKSVQAAQPCNPSIRVGVEADVTEDGAEQIDVNLNGDLCSKSLLDTPSTIVPQDRKAEITAEHPNPPLQKKKKKKKSVQAAQPCDPSIRVGLEADVIEDGAGKIDVNLNGDLCSKSLLDTPSTIVPQDRKAETTAEHPNPSLRKKKKKKSVQAAQPCDPSIRVGVEADVTEDAAGQIDTNLNGDLCSKSLLDTPITIVPQDRKTETTEEHPNPLLQKKKKKKSVQAAQPCDPSIQVGAEADVTEDGAGQIDANLNGDLCSKPLLDTQISIVAEDGNAGTTTQSSNSTPKKKKKKKKSVQGAQSCDPSILVGVEPNIMTEEGARQSDANRNGDLCSKALLDTPIPIVQQDENAERTAKNINPTSQKKNIQGAQQLQTCNQPGLPDPKPMEDTPRKKLTRKKKNVVELPGAEPVESNNTENPGLSSLVPDLKSKMKEGAEDNAEQSRVCPKPELVPPSDIAIPSDLELKKRAQSIEANVEHFLAGSKPELASRTHLPTPMNLEKKIEPESSEAHTQHPQPQPCSNYVPVVPGINEECPVPDPTPAEDTPQIKKSRKKRNVLKPPGAEPEPEPESKESKNTENPQQCPPDLELKIKMKKGAEANAEHFPFCPKPELAPLLGIASRNDSDVKKGAEPTEARVEHPQVCLEPKLVPPIDLPTPINPEKKKEAEPSEVVAQPQPCSTPGAEPQDDPTTPVGQSRRKQKSKRGSVKTMCSEEKVENQGSPLHLDITLNQVQQNPATPICPQPAFLTDQTIPVDPANPIDTNQKMKKKKRKKQKNVLEGEEPNNSKHDTEEQPECPIQTSTCLIATPLIHPAIPMDPCPIPICPAISTDTEQEMSKKKRKKKRKIVPEIEGAEPIEHNDKLPEAPPEATIPKPIYPIAAPSIDPPIIPIGTAPPVDTAIALDQGQRMTEKKRKKKKRSEVTSVGAEPNEPVGKPPETPVQNSVYPIEAPSIDRTIPVSAPPEDTANPIDQGQKTSKKKRKRSNLIREGAELNEHDAEPPGTPVQRSLYPIAAPSIDTTIPTSQASPVDPEQMTKKKKKRKSALKNEGLESEKRNPDPSTETSVQKTEDLAPLIDRTNSTSQSTPSDPEQMTKKKKKRKSSLKNEGLESEKHNANPTAETPVKKTEDPAIPISQATQVDLELMTKKKKIRKSALKNEGLESEKHNADSTTETPVQKTEGPTTENSKRCRACRELGHKFQKCPRLRSLSNNEEICFFCGEIGHSLGKCRLSRAGRVMFANCLFCYEDGHFSYKCPRNGHGIGSKVVAVDGAINRTAVEATVEPPAEV